MTSYTINANGTTMGTYEGATRDEAILAYVREAGYASVEDAADALSQTRGQFLADLDVTEVAPCSDCDGSGCNNCTLACADN